ncbi:hypothetical protein C5L14_04260 [Labrys okinawensis]|uniref:Uncharacterized protein n=1 Tax=Labrys okinawensis TaxID=346911 RepID=A0A2S9QGK5_9HYPH|nr:hypothetical protein C5L14_04260 [Labrys okinawensis]
MTPVYRCKARREIISATKRLKHLAACRHRHEAQGRPGQSSGLAWKQQLVQAGVQAEHALFRSEPDEETLGGNYRRREAGSTPPIRFRSRSRSAGLQSRFQPLGMLAAVHPFSDRQSSGMQ